MDNSFVEILAKGIARLLVPLYRIGSPERLVNLLEDLGWPGVDPVQVDLQNLVVSVNSLTEILSDADKEENFGDYLKLSKQIIEVITILSSSLPRIVDALNQTPGVAATLGQLTTRLFDYLVYIYLKIHHPKKFAIFHLLGLVDEDNTGPIPIKVIRWDWLPTLIINPIKIPNDVYKWNTDFEEAELFTRLVPIVRSFQLPGGVYRQFDAIVTAFEQASAETVEFRLPLFQAGAWPDAYSELSLNLSAIEKDGLKKGLALYPVLSGGLEFEKSLGGDWRVKNESSLSSGKLIVRLQVTNGEWTFEFVSSVSEENSDGFALLLQPPANLKILSTLFSQSKFSEDSHVEFLLQKSRQDGAYTIFSTDTTDLTIQSVAIRLLATLAQKDAELAAELELGQLTFSVSTGNSDGFIQKLTSGLDLKSIFDLTFGLSNLSGFYFLGSADLEINIPTHLPLGPIEIQTTHITVRTDDNKKQVDVALAVSFDADLGPLHASVERIGLSLPFKFPADYRGNLGPVDVGLGFKPPNGVSLSLDTSVVKGGGYLYIDSDKGEYAGALELVFSDFLGLSAIGIITTKRAGGAQGFSLLLIITADFGMGLQLGLGFKLSAVGGLIGLNRSMNQEKLAEGMRTGGVDSIMFPKNVIANITRIISDIRAFFPAQNGHFLIGPMAQLAWGTPTFISLSLGLILEIRTTGSFAIEKIAIIGVLKIALPDEKTRLIAIQVNFIGAIDFSKKTGFFFAALYESRVLFITLEGEMGLLIAWGANSNFLVSVGGFHPQYTPPPLPFPKPVRLSFYLINTSFARLGVQGYFAVTSNTVQFGARSEMFFGLDEFNVSGHFGFDALIQFSPFFFSVSLSYEVSVKVFGAGLFSIQLQFLLEGPGRWRAKGYGKIKVLFLSFKVHFDKKWGDRRNTELPPIEVLPLLEAELEKTENWLPLLPRSNRSLVTLREIPADVIKQDLVLHPRGALYITQRLVPLGIDIDKIGHQKPSDGNNFDLAFDDSELDKIGDRKESFARAQFQKLSKAKKLSSPGFEQLRAGAILSFKDIQHQTKTSQCVKRHNRYELVTIDTAFKRKEPKLIRLMNSLFNHFLIRSVAFISPISEGLIRETRPVAQEIQVQPASFTIVSSVDNKRFAGTEEFSSLAEAEYTLTQISQQDSQLAQDLQVVSTFEVM